MVLKNIVQDVQLNCDDQPQQIAIVGSRIILIDNDVIWQGGVWLETAHFTRITDPRDKPTVYTSS